MNTAKMIKLLAPAVAFSLSACSSSSTTSTSSAPPATSGADHTFVIGQPSATGPALKGSGKWSAIKRKLDQFHAIDVGDCIKVTLDIGKPLSVSVEADDNLIDLIDTKVIDGKLIASAKQSFQSGRPPELFIFVPELSEVKSSGSSEVTCYGVKGDIFKVDLSSSGRFNAKGHVTNEKLTLSGSGSADCLKLKSDNVTVNVSGTGSCIVDVQK